MLSSPLKGSVPVSYTHGTLLQEMDVMWGSEVGYVVRFDTKAKPSTALRYVTDGILLQVHRDPNPMCNLAPFCCCVVHDSVWSVVDSDHCLP